MQRTYSLVCALRFEALMHLTQLSNVKLVDATRLLLLVAAASHCGGKTEDAASGYSRTGQGGTATTSGSGGGTSGGAMPTELTGDQGGSRVTFGSGGGASTGGSYQDSGTSPALRTCNVTSATSGFVACDGAWSHRSTIMSVPSVVPRAARTCDATFTSGQIGSDCHFDSDCPPLPYFSPLLPFCYDSVGRCMCAYSCLSDENCKSNEICVFGVWGNPMGECRASNCKSDADCPMGYCASALVTIDPAHCQPVYACTTTSDECLIDQDCETCGDDGGCFSKGLCRLGPDGRRHCDGNQGCVW
jgi:hypothetical protein